MNKALALVTDAYGARGGIARAARDVIGAISAMDGIDEVLVLPRAAAEAPLMLPANVRNMKPLAGRVPYSLHALRTTVRTKPEVIFCNHLYMAPLAILAARCSGAKLIVQLHGIECWTEPSLGQRRALEAADLLLCVSRDTRRRILGHCDVHPERVVVVNNTVDSCFTPGSIQAAREKFGMREEYVLLAVGRLDSKERYKGHDKVIEALPRLRGPAGRRPVFYICGTGDDQGRLKTLAENVGVLDRIKFLNHVSFSDLPELYRAADLFVLPSTGEGFGIVFLEAMACGTPAVGLAAGGAPDALGDGSLGHMINQSADFALALSAIIEAPAADPSSLSITTHARFGEPIFRRRLDELLRSRILLNSSDACASLLAE